MTGVPAELVIGNDFMIVRGGLVRTLDNANDALVWTRIHWRCEMHGAHVIVDEDGIAWWPASRETLAKETGLRQEQVRRCLERLVEGGFLDTAKHHRNGNYDQTKSYRTVVEGPKPAGGSADATLSARPMSRAVAPNVPLLETVEDNTLLIPSGTSEIDDFETFWKTYPRKTGKGAAVKAWAKAIKSHPSMLIIAGAVRFATDPNLPEKQFIPYPATWLNAGQWDDEPLPSRNDGGGGRLPPELEGLMNR